MVETLMPKKLNSAPAPKAEVVTPVQVQSDKISATLEDNEITLAIESLRNSPDIRNYLSCKKGEEEYKLLLGLSEAQRSR